VDHELEVIRGQMEETRASLADKLEALESQVLGTVHSATETVSSAVEGAKEVVASVTEGAKNVVEKVTDTVESVKESLSVSRLVDQHPWLSMGVSVAAGFAAAQMLPRHHHNQSYADYPPTSYAETSAAPVHPAAYQPAATPPPQRNGIGGALSDLWSKATGTLESLVVGTVMGALKGVVSRSLPAEWQGELTRLLDETTTRMGGKVMHGNPWQELFSSESGAEDIRHGSAG
jgi:ElaB/YqjD/DUF883 family membrane-anchored ribosome-binding protein